jgi:hypothetical protein
MGKRATIKRGSGFFITLMMEAVHTSEMSVYCNEKYTALYPRKLSSSYWPP